ncbi:hypothetical protein [Ascidiimonas sp. W6]|uniref:hypothetical protein n=1 Tax=Ascidiimonas meishanensis TaxID=3128903 RepID=UPI0030EE4AEF
MPRNLKHFTSCASPGDSYPYVTVGNIFAQVGLSLLTGAGFGIILGGIMAVFASGFAWGCGGIAAFIGVLTYWFIQFKDWYNNHRLMCIVKDRCALGTVTHNPTAATDGDRKINLHLAPFTPKETEALIAELLDEMRGELSNVPDLIDLQNRQILVGYLNGMDTITKNKFYIRLVDEKMMSQPNKGFQRHLYRRDEAIMGQPAFDNSDSDLITDEDPNPQFRYDNGGSANTTIVPYLHTEVEGNRLMILLNNIYGSALAGLIVALGICIACDVISLGALDFLCGWIGAAVSVIVALLAFLISWLVNDWEDGNADEIGVDIEEGNFDDPVGTTTTQGGDIVITYGDWIMDEEHGQYFEIHPVKAYYLICRDARMPDIWKLTEEVNHADCDFDVSLITQDDLERMCKLVQAAENTDPKEKLDIDVTGAMAMMP